MEVRPGIITTETADALNEALRRLEELNNVQGAAPIFVTRDSAGVTVSVDTNTFNQTSGLPTTIYTSGSVSGYYTDYPLPDSMLLRLQPTGPSYMRSLAPPLTISGNPTGRVIEIANAASLPAAGSAPNTLTYLHQDLSGSPGMRISTPDTFPLIQQPGETIVMKYSDGFWKPGELRPLSPFTNTMGGGSAPPLPLMAGSVLSGMMGSGVTLPYPTTQGPLMMGTMSGAPRTPSSGYVNAGMDSYFPPLLNASGSPLLTTGPLPYLEMTSTSGITQTWLPSPFIGVVNLVYGGNYGGPLANLASGTADQEIVHFQSINDGSSGGRVDSLGPWIIQQSGSWIRPAWFQSGNPFPSTVLIYSILGDDIVLLEGGVAGENMPWCVGQSFTTTAMSFGDIHGGPGIDVTGAPRNWTVSIISGGIASGTISSGTISIIGQSGITSTQTADNSWTIGETLNVALTGQSGIIATQSDPFTYTIGSSFSISGAVKSGSISSGAIALTGQSGIITTQTSPNAWTIGADVAALSGQVYPVSGGGGGGGGITGSWQKFSYTNASFSTAGTTKTLTAIGPDNGGILLGAKVICKTEFTGGGITSYTLSVGYTGFPDAFCPANGVGPGSSGAFNYCLAGSQVFELQGSTTFNVTADCSGGNLNGATTGTADVFLWYVNPQ